MSVANEAKGGLHDILNGTRIQGYSVSTPGALLCRVKSVSNLFLCRSWPRRWLLAKVGKDMAKGSAELAFPRRSRCTRGNLLDRLKIMRDFSSIKWIDLLNFKFHLRTENVFVVSDTQLFHLPLRTKETHAIMKAINHDWRLSNLNFRVSVRQLFVICTLYRTAWTAFVLITQIAKVQVSPYIAPPVSCAACGCAVLILFLLELVICCKLPKE